MDAIAGIPYTTAEFDRNGQCISQPELADDAREVIIVSHGWNNERHEAENLYQALFTNFNDVHPGSKRGFAIVGVIWPSKKFDFTPEAPSGPESRGVGAAATSGADAAGEQARIERALEQFEHVFAGEGKDEQLAALRQEAARIAEPDAQTRFIELLREFVGEPQSKSGLDASEFFFDQADTRAVFKNVSRPSSEVGNMPTGATGRGVQGAGLGDIVRGVGDAVSSLLNITTYYEMKKRAGTVGMNGLAPLIDQIGARDQVRHIHLVGHSFGARLVTAAAMASSTPKLYSMALLQGAFSHSGFASFGYFRQVVKDKRLAGPIIVTYTENDKAVGKAYAIASRISRDVAEGIGDANDKYGGLGRNGAVNMGSEEVSKTVRRLLGNGERYAFTPRLIHNLESSPYIGDHGAVAGKEVAWAISQAIASAG